MSDDEDDSHAYDEELFKKDSLNFWQKEDEEEKTLEGGEGASG